MALPFENYQRFTREVTLAAGDASKTVMAAVTGVRYYVTSVIVTSLTSAAQAVYVGDSSGTVKALSWGVSLTVNQQVIMQVANGVALTLSEALIVKPAAAGPSVHVVVEGYLTREGAALA